MQPDASQKLKDQIREILTGEGIFKMVLSKPRHPEVPFTQIHLKPFLLKDQKMLSVVFRSPTHDDTKNLSPSELPAFVENHLSEYFYNLDIRTSEKTVQFLQSKQNKASLIIKKIKNKLAVDLSHDHVKKTLLNQEAPYYKSLGLISGGGLVFSKGQKKYNQVHKYIETIHHFLIDEKRDQTFKVADMGSGKAYLTFALHEYLTTQKRWKTEVTGYEARENLVSSCNAIASQHHIEGLSFVTSDISQAPDVPVDMVVALHACDIATDMAIAYGIKNEATYIVLAPCCQKQIRKSMTGHHVLSSLTKHGILEERLAEMLTDGMRALFLQAKGYQTKVFEFVSLEHTQKNVMITAKKTKPDPEAAQQFENIKKTFGISHHFLEKLFEK